MLVLSYYDSKSEFGDGSIRLEALTILRAMRNQMERSESDG
jgi:hypothetical protein